MTVATAMAATISILVLLILRCYVISDCNQNKRGKCSYGAGNEVDIIYHKRTDCCGGEQIFCYIEKHTAQRLSAISIHATDYIRKKKQKQVFTRITIK